MNLSADGLDYQIVNVSQTKDGTESTTESTITFLKLNLAPNDSAIVRCKVDSLSLGTATADKVFIISKLPLDFTLAR